MNASCWWSSGHFCCSTPATAWRGGGRRHRARAARGPPASLARAWCAPLGLAGGMFAALFGTGGVLFALYNAGRIRDKESLRATNAAMIMFSSLVRVVLFGAAGLLTQDGLLATALVLLPALLGGVWLGNRLHAAVP